MTSHDTTTANGAVSHSTTGTSVLDFFGKGGAMRNADEQSVKNAFAAAYNENKTLALKVLFYLADVREGQGERRLFRLCYNWLAINDSTVAQSLLPQVAEFTRYDDIVRIFGRYSGRNCRDGIS